MPSAPHQSSRHQSDDDSCERIALPSLSYSETSLTTDSALDGSIDETNRKLDAVHHHHDSRSKDKGEEDSKGQSEKGDNSIKKRLTSDPLMIRKMAGVDDIPLEDDSHMPAMTLRALLTGLFISSTAAVIQQFFLFKPSRSQVQPLFLQVWPSSLSHDPLPSNPYISLIHEMFQLACLLVGRSLQNIPGPTWWNPGPYSIVSNISTTIKLNHHLLISP